jgi:hypothetical protein
MMPLKVNKVNFIFCKITFYSLAQLGSRRKPLGIPASKAPDTRCDPFHQMLLGGKLIAGKQLRKCK